MHDLTIVIPAYNEAESLARHLPDLLRFCEEHESRLIIVNDGSHDNTHAVLKQHAAHPRFLAIAHKINRGYGGAIKTGLRRVGTRYAITIDADGQHRLDDVARLYRDIVDHNADLVIGRRPQSTSSAYRRIGKALIRGIARILLPIKVEDLNSGMKIYLTDIVQRYLDLCPDTMAYSDIITLLFINQRHYVRECDIEVNPRLTGVSTIGTKTAIDTMLEILNIVVLINPTRVFLPLALTFLLVGIGWGLPILLSGEGISVGTVLLIVSGLLFFVLGLLAEQLSLIRKSGIRRN